MRLLSSILLSCILVACAYDAEPQSDEIDSVSQPLGAACGPYSVTIGRHIRRYSSTLCGDLSNYTADLNVECQNKSGNSSAYWTGDNGSLGVNATTSPVYGVGVITGTATTCSYSEVRCYCP